MARDYYDESKKKEEEKKKNQQDTTSKLALGRQQTNSTANKAQTGSTTTSQSSSVSGQARGTFVSDTSTYTQKQAEISSSQSLSSRSTRERQNQKSYGQTETPELKTRTDEYLKIKKTARETRRTEAQYQKTYGGRRTATDDLKDYAKTQRRTAAQLQKSGDSEGASRILSGGKVSERRTKLEQWDKDISDTISHTLKQSAAGELRTLNKAAQGITLKDRSIYFTQDQINKADAKVAARDEKLGRKIEKETQVLEDIQSNHGYLGRQALSAVSSATGMAMDIAAGAVVPGSSLANMWIRSTGTSMGQVNRKAENLRRQLKATGQYTDRELDEMFKNVDAMDLANAAASGGIEVLSELLFPGIGAARKVIGGKGASIAEKVGAKLAGKYGAKATGGLLKSLTKGTIEEVAEEEIGGPLQALSANLIYGNKFQGYNEDAVKRSLAEQSNALRGQITSEEDARQAAARLSSSSFMEESIKTYMDSGMSRKEAEELAGLSRDYLTASLSGDVDAMKEYQDAMVNKLAGGENDQKEKWTFQDAIDAAVSTSMMTLTTGMPSALSTMAIGNSYKENMGLDAVKEQAEIIKNWGDEKEKAKAQAIIDHIDSGGDLSGTQVYEIIQEAGEIAEQSREPEMIKNRVAQVEMEKDDLRISPVNPDGSFAPQTRQRYVDIVNQTVARYETLAKLSNKSDSAEDFVGPSAPLALRNTGEEFNERDVAIGANIGAAFETGVITSEMVNDLASGSETVKAVFRDVTGIDVDQFDSAVDMQRSIMAEAAQNMVNSARLEQVAWNDEARKQASDYLVKDVGGEGTKAVDKALESVDPRDRTTFLMMGDVARNIYDFGRYTEGTWEEAKLRYKSMYPSLDSKVLKQVFDAAKKDKDIAETEGYGKVVAPGKPIDRSSLSGADAAYVPGKFTDKRQDKEGAKLSEESMLKSFVTAFGINIDLVDTEVRDKNGNILLEKNDNGAFIPSTNTLIINTNADVTRTITQTAVHELTHHIAVYAPEEYIKLQKYIMDAWYRQDAAGFERAIKQRQALYKAQKNQELSVEQALEEIIADGAADFNWGDADFIAEVTTKEPTLADKIIDAIKDVLRKLRSILASGDVTDEAANEALYAKVVELDTVRSLWVQAAQTARKARASEAINEWQDKANGNVTTETETEEYRSSISEPSNWDQGIFGLTGEPISQGYLDAVEYLENGGELGEEGFNVDWYNSLDEVKEARKRIGDAEETYKDNSPERIKMREKWVQDLMNYGSATDVIVDGKHKTKYNGVVRQDKRIDIIVGLPSSGKSSALVDPISFKYKSRLLDSDEAKKLIPEFDDGWGAGRVHEESSDLLSQAFFQSLENGDNIVMPIVGKSVDSIEKRIAAAKEHGYEVHVRLCDMPPNIAAARNMKRFINRGRFVDLAITSLNVLNGPKESFDAIVEKGDIDGYTEVSNNVERGQNPEFIRGEEDISYDWRTSGQGREGVLGDLREAEEGEGTEEVRYSVQANANAIGLEFRKKGEASVLLDADGNEVDEVTREMVINSPLGNILAESVRKGILPEAVIRNEHESEDPYDEVDFVVDVMNMILKTQNIDMLYAISGTLGYDPTNLVNDTTPIELLKEKGSRFLHIRSNSENQYGTTVDFTTICVKTQAVIDAMSAVMKKRKGGLTKDEVINIVYKEVYNAGEQVPCPVCYVFSRWVGLGGIFDTMRDMQEKFPESMDTEDIRREFSTVVNQVDRLIAESEKADKKLKGTQAREAYYKLVQDRLNELDQIEFYSGVEALKDKYTFTDEMKAEKAKLTRELELLDAWSWLKNARLQPTYKPVPLDILYDINAGKEFAESYPDSWKFRTTRGAGMGKAAVPYTPAILGNTIMGINSGGKVDTSKRSSNVFTDLSKNPFLHPETERNAKSIKTRIANAVKKVKAQNIMNGQRLQSTSDFRFEYALDYLMNFLEFSAVGAKAQLYTKVPEAVPFLASTGTECNCSIMAKGTGIAKNRKVGDHYVQKDLLTGKEVETDQPYSLVFSDVTGMAIEDALAMSQAYDNVQPILVAIGKEHLITALANKYITMVIPYHSSGNTLERYRAMMDIVGESVEDREDFSEYESEHSFADDELTDEQKLNREIRTKILTGKYFVKNSFRKPSEAEAKALSNNENLRQLFIRFYGKDELGNDAKPDPKYVENFDENGNDADCYHVVLNGNQASVIMPHEYWDKTSTIKDADKQGAAYVAYCQSLGYRPVFSGWDSHGRFHEDMDFTKYPGYWKTLIDRCMYNRDGSYHKQQAVRVKDADLSMISASEARKNVVKPLQVNDPGKTAAIADRIYDQVEAKRAVEAEQEKQTKMDAELAKRRQWLEKEGVYIESDAEVLSGPPDIRFSITPEMDAAYMDAVNSGNMEEAQRLVDEVAYTRNYIAAAHHGTPNGGFTEFGGSQTRNGAKAPGVIWFAEEEDHANVYRSYPGGWPRAENPQTYHVYLDTGIWADIGNGRVEALDYSKNGWGDASKDLKRVARAIVTYTTWQHRDESERTRTRNITNALTEIARDISADFVWQVTETQEFANLCIEQGLDSVVAWEEHHDGDGKSHMVKTWGVFNPSQVKSSDPVTYAEDGSIIPLSERFDPSNNDIRYSLPTTDSDGEILTDAQMEHFNRSQARDEMGRLLVLYHYSDALFESFDADLLGTTSGDEYGSTAYGFYTTDDRAFASRFGKNEYKLYANIVNPIIHPYRASQKYSPEECEAITRRWLEAVDPEHLENYREAREEDPGLSLYDYYMNITAPGESPFEYADYEREVLEDKGFDGLLLIEGTMKGAEKPTTSYVLFNREQPKFTENKNPTNAPEMRFSVSGDNDNISYESNQFAYDNSYEALAHYEELIDQSKGDDYYVIYDSALEDMYLDAKKYIEKNVDEFYAGLNAFADDYRSDDAIIEEGRNIMAKSKQEYFNSLDAKWNDRWRTEGTVLEVKSVKKQVRELVKSVMQNSATDHVYKTSMVNRALIDMRLAYDLAKRGREDVAYALLWHSSLRMIDGVEFYEDDGTYEAYKGLRDYLKSTKISLGREYWADVKFGEFRKRNGRRIKLVKGNTNVDKVYQELQEQWPEWFDEEDISTPPEQLLQIEHVLDAIKPYKAAYSSEEAAELATDIANDLFNIMTDEGKEVKSLADRYNEKYDKDTKALKVRHAEAMLKVRQEKNEAVRKTNEKWVVKEQKRKERLAHNDAFSQIQKSYKALYDRLTTNTADKHIPEQYKLELSNLLLAFDLQTARSKKLEAMRGYKAKNTIRLAEMRSVLKKIGARSDLFIINDAITDIMDDLLGENSAYFSHSIEGESIDQLSAAELKKIDKLLKALLHEFNNYENVRINQKKQQAADLGHAMVDSCLEHAQIFKGQGKDYLGLVGALDKIPNLDEVTAAYMFRRIDPNGVGMRLMFDEINRSFDHYVRNMEQLQGWMQEILGEYQNHGRGFNKYGADKIAEWRNPHSRQRIYLEKGMVELTPAQIMSLYCLSKRAQAHDHMTGAGIVVAPVTFNAKLISDLKPKAMRSNLPQRLTDYDIERIIEHLTPEQKAVADKLQELMATKMAEWGNEASMNVLGIRLFEDPDYFPIWSDKKALTKDLTEDQFIEAIRSFGFTKAVLPGARNAIMIDDIFTVVSEHCNNMNLYNSYSESMNDFMKVYNYRDFREDGSEYTVEQAIANAYSQKATTFIRQFMKDLNGNVSKSNTGIISAINDLLGKAKKASVFANVRVLLQQPTAITRAFAVIDPKYLKGIKIEPGAMKEMFEHCPRAWWKSQGYYDINMGRSVEDVMMNNGKFLDDIATNAYGWADNITWTAIWQMCKAKVEDTHRNVEKGSDEYWELCNETMTEVVDLTQVMDSPIHRSHGMRSKDIIMKSFTSFMAEPTLTFNMLKSGFTNAYEEIVAGDTVKGLKILGRTASVLVLQAATVSAAAALWDAVRGKNGDDEDEQNNFLNLWWINVIENFKDEMKIWNKVYFIKDIASVMQGYDFNNLAIQGFKMIRDGWNQLTGQKRVYSSKEWYENLFGGLGYLTGLPIKTLIGDVKAIYKLFGLDWEVANYIGGYLDDTQERFTNAFGNGDEDTPAASFFGFFNGNKAEEEEKKGLFERTANKLGYKKIGANSEDVVSEKTTEDSEYDIGDLPDNLTDEQKEEIRKAGEKRTKKNEGKEEEGQLDYDTMLYKAMKASAGLEGEDFNKAVYSSVAQGLKGYIADGDYLSIGMMRTVIEQAGGDVDYFDQRVLAETKTAYKKTLTYDQTVDEYNNMRAMYRYMAGHGMSQDQISEIVYESDMAKKDMKVAYIMGDSGMIAETMTPLLNAGITREDLEKLYKNRNRIDLQKYKESGGRYAERLKSRGTFIWPTQGTITSKFGYRGYVGPGASTNHPSIDIGAPEGTEVVAADGGVVIYAGTNGGYGNSVGIKHDNGMVTYYNHLSGWNVNVGDTVAQGQPIAQVGSTGISTGPHLDFKILDKDGEPVDPEQYLN